MTTATKPARRPANIHFSSGPCAKRPGWSLENLDKAFLGRSHRAKEGKARLKLAIDKTKALLGLPAGYVCGIVPASDTGAFEMAMWTMLGPPRRRCAGLGELRQGLGDRRRQAAQDQGPARDRGRVRPAARSRQGRFRPRRALHLERHHIGRARAQRRLDPGQARRAHLHRRHLGHLGAADRLGRRSMSPPTPGRRCWAGRRRTAC